jgi:hypothetical protein
MTTQISINILHGSASVTDEDRERAEAAALKVLGAVEPGAAYAEYQRQFEALDDENGMTGLAALWIAATKAADLALTEGWHNPNGAACSLSA